MFTVSKAAWLLGLSERTIRRDLEKVPVDAGQMPVMCRSDAGHVLITDFGLKWLAQRHDKQIPQQTERQTPPQNKVAAGCAGAGDSVDDISGSDLVSSLLEQLEEKDRQIAEKDKQIAEKDSQISQLIEQGKNFQVLLQAQQVLSLPAPKRSIWKRIFGIDENEERRKNE